MKSGKVIWLYNEEGEMLYDYIMKEKEVMWLYNEEGWFDYIMKRGDMII